MQPHQPKPKMRFPLRPVLVLGVLGCNNATDPGQPPVFAVTPAAQWSGGTITVRSEFFVGRTTLPPVTIGNDTLSLLRVDDTTVTTVLPLGPSGSLTVMLQRQAGAQAIGTVARVGFRESVPLPQPIIGELYKQTIAGNPTVFGLLPAVTNWAGEIASVNLAAGTGRTYGGLLGPSDFYYGMSPTGTPGQFVVRTAALEVETWNLEPLPSRLDSTPFVPSQFVRQVAPLAPHIWLQTSHHYTWTFIDTLPYPNRPVDLPIESPWDIYISPRGDRTTVSVNAVRIAGVPVFDNATGDTAFTLPLRGVYGAAFSDDGAVLFASGGYVNPSRIVAVDADDGTLLAQTTLPQDMIAFDLAADQSSGLLFAAAYDSTFHGLLVFDATTLTMLGKLPAPDHCSVLPNVCQGTGIVAVDPLRRRAYLVNSAPQPSWTFDLLL
jgi:hypothetical protein